MLFVFGNTHNTYYLYTNNQAAEHLATQPNMRDNSRSIDTQHHEIKQYYVEGVPASPSNRDHASSKNSFIRSMSSMDTIASGMMDLQRKEKIKRSTQTHTCYPQNSPTSSSQHISQSLASFILAHASYNQPTRHHRNPRRHTQKTVEYHKRHTHHSNVTHVTALG
jgi:hypothetical protein